MALNKWVPCLVLSCLPLFSTSASSMELQVVNRLDSTIYRLYVWPSQFLPRTNNVLDFPLNGQDTATIDVDNSFDECSFTFMMDLNSSPDSKKILVKRAPMVFDYHNICSDPKPIVLMSDPEHSPN